MDSPYIIWTFRRTGGTTLASILSSISTHRSIQHEPFNPDRVYGSISKEWQENGDISKVRRTISAILADMPVIKHCFELVPMQLNMVLLQESMLHGYRHIFLKRKSEVDRLYSLEVASQTGAWGPEAAKLKYSTLGESNDKPISLNLRSTLLHMGECYVRTRWLSAELKRRKCNFASIHFEDLYRSSEMGALKVSDLLLFLGHDAKTVEAMQPFIAQKLASGDQETSSIEKHIENSPQWRRTILENYRALHLSAAPKV